MPERHNRARLLQPIQPRPRRRHHRHRQHSLRRRSQRRPPSGQGVRNNWQLELPLDFGWSRAVPLDRFDHQVERAGDSGVERRAVSQWSSLRRRRARLPELVIAVLLNEKLGASHPNGIGILGGAAIVGCQMRIASIDPDRLA